MVEKNSWVKNNTINYLQLWMFKTSCHVVILTCNENYMCNKIDVADCDKLKILMYVLKKQ